MQTPIIEQWLEHYGANVQVYFTLNGGACKHCQQKHLANGIGTEPTLFLLLDIIEGHTRLGGNIEDLYPSGALPICCNRTISVKPPDTIWSNDKQRHIVVRNTYGVNRKSKIQVIITVIRDKA